MFCGGVMFTPAGIALLVTQPFGRMTAVGAFIGLSGLTLLGGWWFSRPASPGRLGRLQTWGAVLALLTPVFALAAMILWFNEVPVIPQALAVVAVLSLAARVTVGARARTAARAPRPEGTPMRSGQPLARKTSR